MSKQDPRHTALRQAVRAGVPYAYTSGTAVVLVLSAQQDPITGQVKGQALRKDCSSAGLAKAVAARVVGDLKEFPAFAARILDISEDLVRKARAGGAEASASVTLEGTTP